MKHSNKNLFRSGVRVHMIGVSGIGMSALAAFLVNAGCDVSGTDMECSTDVPEEVNFLGEQHEGNISDNVDVVICSHAIPNSNPELKKARDLDLKVMTYPEAVGELTKDYKLVCISGTHGKSTTTSMLAKILVDAGVDPNVIVGTRSPDLAGKNYRVGKSDIFLLEACEYKEAFLNYVPDMIVITNIEPDHLDYFETEDKYVDAFAEFVEGMKDGGLVVLNFEDELSKEVVKDVRHDKKEVSFKTDRDLTLKVIGRHNVHNALLAITAAELLGVGESEAIESVQAFGGTWRRLEFKGEWNGAHVYDDYAHHPTEILATLRALRGEYPRKSLVCVFQPHQYSRTIELFDGFVDALQEACTVVIPNIYRVRDTDEDVERMSPEELVEAINDYEGVERAVFGDGFEGTIQILKDMLNKNHVCVVMGAGDVTKICEMLDQ